MTVVTDTSCPKFLYRRMNVRENEVGHIILSNFIVKKLG